MLGDVHKLISIPPKYSVSHIVGFLKGKTALYVANKYARKRCCRDITSGRGYFLSTSGYDGQVVRRYIRNQEKVDKASDFADLFNRSYEQIAKPLLAFQISTSGGSHDFQRLAIAACF
nr:transposase [uncultured Shinella sp.]